MKQKFLSQMMIIMSLVCISHTLWAAPAVHIAVGELVTATATVPISTSTSQAIPTAGLSLVGLTMPAAFTGTAISFTVSNTLAGTYVPVTTSTSGTALSYAVAASKYVAIDPKDFAGVQFFKIVSNGTEAAARAVVCSMKGI